ncbi:pigment precursor permease [Artemisia annua]|uniref:Pigment permease n=1 Tax=Artemisia annua TaxID=35608 RepID=A0A2U1L023_ARTAN|nr:pigment precursor permease [Artemisia annua]
MYYAIFFVGINNPKTVQPVVATDLAVFYRESAAEMYYSLPYAMPQALLMVKHKGNSKLQIDDLMSEKRINDAAARDGSGQHVLGKVAMLLKQVQEIGAKAKLEVEVKVKKMDQGDPKENCEVSD